MKTEKFESIRDMKIQNLDKKQLWNVLGGRRQKATQEITCTPKGNDPNDAD
ncbi:MAG: hypothetical protein IKO46_01450 [Salinivirgaceae bacterium]|nr:hypothetical protein [Salinivirgaceae bacterium]